MVCMGSEHGARKRTGVKHGCVTLWVGQEQGASPRLEASCRAESAHCAAKAMRQSQAGRAGAGRGAGTSVAAQPALVHLAGLGEDTVPVDRAPLAPWRLYAAAPAGGAGPQLRVAAAAVLLQDLLQREATAAMPPGAGWAAQAGGRAGRRVARRQADDGAAGQGRAQEHTGKVRRAFVDEMNCHLADSARSGGQTCNQA